jgi:hypothetical protein
LTSCGSGSGSGSFSGSGSVSRPVVETVGKLAFYIVSFFTRKKLISLIKFIVKCE